MHTSPPVPANEPARLAALAQYKVLDSAAEAAYDDITFIASSICETPISVVTLIDKDRQWFKSKLGLAGSETPREQAFCAHTIMQSEPLMVFDAQTDDRFSGNPFVTGEPRIRFYAGVPLINPEGFALGSLCVVDQKPRSLTEAQSRALQALGRQVMTLLELRRTAAALAEEVQKVKTLSGLLPICSFCKGIRDDKGYWSTVESYIMAHSDARFSHGVCMSCMKKHYPQLLEASLKEKGERKPAAENK